MLDAIDVSKGSGQMTDDKKPNRLKSMSSVQTLRKNALSSQNGNQYRTILFSRSVVYCLNSKLVNRKASTSSNKFPRDCYILNQILRF